LSCSSIGPFPDLPQASQAQAALKQAGYEPRQRIEQGELWVGYWVSVQDLATRAAAEKAVETLRANGITDVYLMPGTDPENVLSLGVFSDYQRAQKRADEVKELGFEPRIDDRKREGSVWWIDVDLAEPGQLIDTTILQTGPGRILRLEMRACPEAANG
jgi:SPOR domain